MRKWSLLNKDTRIVSEIVLNWKELLSNKHLKEEAYHQFLAEHAGIFFGSPGGCYTCASKVDLGSDHQTDFVVPHDEGSYGFIYEFIEIESPHSPAFTSKGAPSQRLVNAIQQVTNWRDWLAANMTQTRKLFPSKMLHVYNKARFNFTIYISRRAELAGSDHLRMQQEIAHNISIRSFDRLTEWAESRPYLDESCLYSAEENRLGQGERNELANPFYVAMTGKEWKELVSESEFHVAHMYANNAPLLLNVRRYNQYADRFLATEG
jgi:hypothetical protein